MTAKAADQSTMMAQSVNPNHKMESIIEQEEIGDVVMELG